MTLLHVKPEWIGRISKLDCSDVIGLDNFGLDMDIRSEMLILEYPIYLELIGAPPLNFRRGFRGLMASPAKVSGGPPLNFRQSFKGLEFPAIVLMLKRLTIH